MRVFCIIDIGKGKVITAKVNLASIMADSKDGIFGELSKAIVVQALSKVLERRGLEVLSKNRFDGVHIDNNLIS